MIIDAVNAASDRECGANFNASCGSKAFITSDDIDNTASARKCNANFNTAHDSKAWQVIESSNYFSKEESQAVLKLALCYLAEDMFSS